jgi:uncharacterized protein YecE (DUF72 family)
LGAAHLIAFIRVAEGPPAQRHGARPPKCGKTGSPGLHRFAWMGQGQGLMLGAPWGIVKLRFGLGAWTNAHFDHALYPIGTPHAEYLPRYASRFTVAEADVLHHRLPEPGEIESWCQQTPKNFRFLPKMWKQVTHGDGGVTGAKQWLSRLEPLREHNKLGPILLQFPPSLERTAGWEQVESLLRLDELGTFAVEVRHRSWFVPAFEELLLEHEASLVWSTYPKAFAPPWNTGDTGYIRFSGNRQPKRGRHVTVADRLADALAMRKRLASASWKEAFVIVTNPFEGNAVDSLPRIAAALGELKLAKSLQRPPGEVLFASSFRTG